MSEDIRKELIKSCLLEKITNKKLSKYITFLQSALLLYSLLNKGTVESKYFEDDNKYEDIENFIKEKEINLQKDIDLLEELSSTGMLKIYSKHYIESENTDMEYKECYFNKQKPKKDLNAIARETEAVYNFPLKMLQVLYQLERADVYYIYYDLYDIYKLINEQNHKFNTVCFPNGYTTDCFQLLWKFSMSEYMEQFINLQGNLKNYKTLVQDFLKKNAPPEANDERIITSLTDMLLPGFERPKGRTANDFYYKQILKQKK